MYEDFFRRRGREVLFFRYAPPLPERHLPDDLSSAKQPNPPHPNAPGWKHSVYYYWYRFLRQNTGFKRFCDHEKLEPNTVAYDFRHVFQMNFRDWWAEHGRFLFCEPPRHSINVEKLPLSDADLANRLLLSIPADADLEQTLSDLRSLLQPILANNKASAGGSRARYPVWTKPVLTSLEQHLRVWLIYKENRDLSFVEIANLAGFLQGQKDDVNSRNHKSAIASRLVKQAEFMIAQAAHGRFPVMTQKQLDAGLPKFPNIPPSGMESTAKIALINMLREQHGDDPETLSAMLARLKPE